jgi:hypothetical protein
MALAVTTYVPIPNHPRTREKYEDLGKLLLAAGIPIVRLDGTLEDCWLHRYLQDRYAPGEFTHSVADNPAKNSVGYHVVQAQKSELLAITAERVDDAAEVLVWIDLGIFHLPGMTPQVIRDFMWRADDELAIAIPGCWNLDYEYDDRYPCWRFCGGLMVVPCKYAAAFDYEMKAEYKRHLRETNNLSWEVNTLSRLERRGTSLPLWHYRANHDSSIFSNYRATEHADGKAQVV